VRRRLLGNDTNADSVACLLATPQSEMRERNEPIRQNGERFPAWMANAAADPDALVSVIVRLSESPSVADDRLPLAKRAHPRQPANRNHPGSMLSCVSGSAIKRITAGVKARR
jgi:hypothetical protein